MIGRAAAAINVFIVLAALSVLAARAAPVHSDVNQLSQSFRTSVAHSIRDNVARQQLAHIDDSTADVALPSAPVVALPIPSSAIVPAIRAPEPSPAQLSDDILSANVPVDAVRTSEQSTIEAEQAKNAHYSFDTSVKDTINDHSQTRQETRDGVTVRGSYSYSDGFFQRTVHYTADEGGYRVTKEEITPIGDGPRYNPQGTADVRSSLTGNYLITADDFKTSTTEKTAAASTL